MNQYKTLICKYLTIRYTICHHVAPHGVTGKLENDGKEGARTQKAPQANHTKQEDNMQQCGSDRTPRKRSDEMANGSRYMQNCEAELLLSPLTSFSKNQAAGSCVFSSDMVWGLAPP